MLQVSVVTFEARGCAEAVTQGSFRFLFLRAQLQRLDFCVRLRKLGGLSSNNCGLLLCLREFFALLSNKATKAIQFSLLCIAFGGSSNFNQCKHPSVDGIIDGSCDGGRYVLALWLWNGRMGQQLNGGVDQTLILKQ